MTEKKDFEKSVLSLRNKESWTRVRIDTIEACGAVSIRAVGITVSHPTVKAIAALRSGIHLITNCSTAVNIFRPHAHWTHGVLVANIE